MCRKASVRFDAGYPGNALLSALEERGTDYIAPAAQQPRPRRPGAAGHRRGGLPELGRRAEGAGEPRVWFCEPEPYQAKTWPRARRVVQVIVERPGELFPRSFWLLTSLSAAEAPPEKLLELYRKRGKAEGHTGELKSVVAPALSSSPRPKRHYRGRPVRRRTPGVDAFACNRARLLLAVFGCQIMHVQRALPARATGTGWSLKRLLERVLRAPARFTVSGHRITMIAPGERRTRASGCQKPASEPLSEQLVRAADPRSRAQTRLATRCPARITAPTHVHE